MNDLELETRLRAANLRDAEIAPLSAERSAAILSHALATARKPDRGDRHSLSFLSGWRPSFPATRNDNVDPTTYTLGGYTIASTSATGNHPTRYCGRETGKDARLGWSIASRGHRRSRR